MGLTKERERTLSALYARWGADAVREDLDRNGWLVPPEVAAYARAWIAAEERRRKRSAVRVDLMRASAIGLLAGALLVRIVQGGLLF